MNYSKQSDKYRVNGTAIFCYTLIVAILTVSYLVEVLKKSRTMPYFIAFLALLLIPYIISQVLFRRDKESDRIRYIIAVGFVIFNVFVIFTTVSPVVYIYGVIVAVALSCYNDNKLITRYMMGITAGNIAHVIYQAVTHQITSEMLPNT